MANTTTITGNLTREPEIRYTRDGQATTQLGVAVNRRWQDRATQEWHETTSYFDVVCWRDLAENVALPTLTKGMRVVVTGRLEQRSWENEEGEKRSKVEITADEIGPSLRFATADVQKVERRGPAEANGDGAGDGEVVALDRVSVPSGGRAHRWGQGWRVELCLSTARCEAYCRRLGLSAGADVLRDLFEVLEARLPLPYVSLVEGSDSEPRSLSYVSESELTQ